MKRLISILSVFTLLFLILGCNEDNIVEPLSPKADEQPSSLSKLTTRLNFTGTETFDAVSDPSRILDPGTVIHSGNKIIIKGMKILTDISMEVEGMGLTKGQIQVIMNGVWDNVTFSGPVAGTFESPVWKGIYRGYRSKIGDKEWLGELKLEAIGIGDFEGLAMKAKEMVSSDLRIPMRYIGTMKGQILVPNPPM